MTINERFASRVEPVRWTGDTDGYLELLDQRALPAETRYLRFDAADHVRGAIVDMVVRGAPAIALAAAFGIVLAAREAIAGGNEHFEQALAEIAAARPTAVNLRWAVERIKRALEHSEGAQRVTLALAEARAIRDEDIAANVAIGDAGAALLPNGARVLTICNTGSLATAGWGTALGIVRSAWRDGRLAEVYACETRPYLQGARLTMYELMADKIPATLITDSMAAHLMQRGMIDAVVAGADRVAANGDTANKIGTYSLAVLARYHGVPFYIAAPRTTIDLATLDGESIPIEERAASEVTELRGISIAPAGARALHPAFDMTPGTLIRAIVTECGAVAPPYAQTLRAVMAQ